jgi:hypothetical protein
MGCISADLRPWRRMSRGPRPGQWTQGHLTPPMWPLHNLAPSMSARKRNVKVLRAQKSSVLVHEEGGYTISPLHREVAFLCVRAWARTPWHTSNNCLRSTKVCTRNHKHVCLESRGGLHVLGPKMCSRSGRAENAISPNLSDPETQKTRFRKPATCFATQNV